MKHRGIKQVITILILMLALYFLLIQDNITMFICVTIVYIVVHVLFKINHHKAIKDS